MTKTTAEKEEANMKSDSTSPSAQILHIEDGDDWLRHVRRALERAGLTVRHAKSLAKAASLLNSIEFDAIVTDIRLKDWEEDNVEGLDALRAVSENRRPAAIVLSGYLDGDNTRLAFKELRFATP